MRKCIRCGSIMKENCGIRVDGVTYGIVMTGDEKKAFSSRLGQPKVAICVECGEISMYVENTEKLKTQTEMA